MLEEDNVRRGRRMGICRKSTVVGGLGKATLGGWTETFLTPSYNNLPPNRNRIFVGRHKPNFKTTTS